MNPHSVVARDLCNRWGAESTGGVGSAPEARVQGDRRRQPVLTRLTVMTAKLEEVLTDEAEKSKVIDDCCELIDAEVKDKGGLSGLAIKAGYGAVKSVK